MTKLRKANIYSIGDIANYPDGTHANMPGKVGASEAAAAWGITNSSVRRLISRNREAGAELVIIDGKATWTMPVHARPEQLKPGVKPGQKINRRKE